MKQEKNAQLELKRENRNRVFNKIREEGSMSRSALSRELNLSLPTVTQNLTELMELGVIWENGSFGHTGGRRARAYSVNGRSRLAVGVDITRNHISIVVVDCNGDVICRDKVQRSFALTDEFLQQLGALIEQTLDACKTAESKVLGVGVAVQAIVSADHQQLYYGKTLQRTGTTAQQLRAFIPYPCRMYNDAEAAGYAELVQHPDIRDMFYISLSDNIGGSVLIDNKVYRGDTPKSGEVGHLTIHPAGRDCYCGQRGCFDAYCSASVLRRDSDMELPEFFAQLEAGNTACQSLWEEYLHNLAIVVNDIRMLFDCSIIVGGYVGAYMEPYLQPLKALVQARNPFETDTDYLSICRVKEEALALGSALPFVHEHWQNI